MIKKWLPAVSADEGDTYNVIAVFTDEKLRDKFFDSINSYYTDEVGIPNYVVKQSIRVDPSPEENYVSVQLDLSTEK